MPHLEAAAAQHGDAAITIISSVSAAEAQTANAYGALKAAQIHFAKGMAKEKARQHVRVNVVCPGPTDTALLQSFTGGGEFGQKIYDGLKRAIPLKRLGQPEDIPGAVAFLSSDDANFITGQVISVSGGLTMHG